MRRDELPDDLVLSEAQVREVIELAARAAPRSEGISLADLRQIALELDIEEAALADALRVVLARPARSRSPLGLALNRLLPQKGRWIAGGLVGGLLGWSSAYLAAEVLERVINGLTIRTGSGLFVDGPVSILLILLTLANLLARRVEGRRGRYLAETLATWSAFAAAWSITSGRLTEDLLRFLLICVSALGLWGWLVIRPPRDREKDARQLQAHYDEVLRRASKDVDDTSAPRARTAWKGMVSPRLLGIRFNA